MINTLKSSVSAVVLTLFLASQATAADVYTKGGGLKDDPAVHDAPAMVNWSGFYLGGQIGYGISQHELTTTTITDFPAVQSSCWARGAWTSTNTPTADPNDFDLNIAPGSDPIDANGQLPVNPADNVDDRIHVVEAGASVTDVTAEECADIRKDLNITNAAGVDQIPGVVSGYDPSVDAYTVTDTFKGASSDSGLIGGGRVGFDVARGRILFGVFGDYNWSDIEALEGEWTAAARLGYIVAPRTMAYVLAGYTQSDYNFGGGDVTFGGITAGGGIEFAVSSNVFLGLEYQHTFYDSETIVDVPGLKVEDELDVDRILATLKFKLNNGLIAY